MILWDGLLFTFAFPNSKLASGFCPDSLASLLTRNGPSFVKSCLISFSITSTLSKALSYSEADDSNIWCDKWRQDHSRRKRTDRLQLHAELMSELSLYFFQTPLSFLR